MKKEILKNKKLFIDLLYLFFNLINIIKEIKKKTRTSSKRSNSSADILLRSRFLTSFRSFFSRFRFSLSSFSVAFFIKLNIFSFTAPILSRM